jgi:hypothetical protein
MANDVANRAAASANASPNDVLFGRLARAASGTTAAHANDTMRHAAQHRDQE